LWHSARVDDHHVMTASSAAAATVAATEVMYDFYFLNQKTKISPIENDYRISNNVLGLGINGKVVQCFSVETGNKYALKVRMDKNKHITMSCYCYIFVFQVLVDCNKARREIDLHWRASGCINIVNIIDVYENMYMDKKCLLVVMEW